MAERKVFAGARLKRLRLRLALTQTQMAAELGVSPSYLNLIERNQRPLTVQVLLKLSAAYGIDVRELSGDDGGGLVDRLREVFSDPLLSGEIASPTEISELAEAAPNAARGMTRLHEAWREALERLSDLSQRMVSPTDAPQDAFARLPLDGAEAYFEEAGPWFPELEAAAEELSGRLAPRDDPALALKTHLREAFGVDTRILPGHVMPVEQARFDRHSLRLFISERAALVERPFLMARHAALIGSRDLLDALTRAAAITEPEAARLCRLGFARRMAEAILAPAGRLVEAARALDADVMRLSERFVLRPSRLMARLAAVGAGGRGLPPAFCMLLDASGGVLSRLPGAGFPFPRFGPFCGRLPTFDGLPAGRPATADVEFPDGSAFCVVAVAEEGAWSPGLPPPRRIATIGWRRADADGLLRTARDGPARPVGVTCRLCERDECAHRVHAPVTRPAAFQDHVVGPAGWD